MTYFTDKWNYINLGTYASIIFVGVLRLTLRFWPERFGTEMDTLILQVRIMVFAILVMLANFFYFLRGFRKFGVLVRMVLQARIHIGGD